MTPHSFQNASSTRALARGAGVGERRREDPHQQETSARGTPAGGTRVRGRRGGTGGAHTVGGGAPRSSRNDGAGDGAWLRSARPATITRDPRRQANSEEAFPLRFFKRAMWSQFRPFWCATFFWWCHSPTSAAKTSQNDQGTYQTSGKSPWMTCTLFLQGSLNTDGEKSTL